MATAAPTAEGYQEHEPCRECRGNGRSVDYLAPNEPWPPRGTWLGSSDCGQYVYVWVRCRACQGAGVPRGAPPREVEAWADLEGFRWPEPRPGHLPRGSVWRGEGSLEGDSAAGALSTG